VKGTEIAEIELLIYEKIAKHVLKIQDHVQHFAETE
jgi:hypothetical protein